MSALLRVGRNVPDLAVASRFYGEALGFAAVGPAAADPALAALLGVRGVSVLRMRLGAQEIELSVCDPPGAPYPEGGRAHDLTFQHLAIVTADIMSACSRLAGYGSVPISRRGPQLLPAASGGVTAFKFRDPFGHPLEFLAFPGAPRPAGFDHSGISISDVSRSLAFYEGLGLVLAGRQVNQGAEQDALDGLDETRVDVLALHPARPAPHVELLHYRQPVAGVAPLPRLYDIAADRLVFAGDEGGLWRDPDGHVIVVDLADSARRD